MPTPVANDRRRPMTGWTADDLPDLSGKTAIVTGANRGLGYQTALELARNGAHVLLAARDPARGTAALERLRADAPASRAELVELNVADLDSVRRFAEAFLARRGTGPTDQQRRGHGHPPARADRGGLRAAARHEPPRPLRPDRPAPASAAAAAQQPRGHRQQQPPQAGHRHRLRRPPG